MLKVYKIQKKKSFHLQALVLVALLRVEHTQSDVYSISSYSSVAYMFYELV